MHIFILIAIGSNAYTGVHIYACNWIQCVTGVRIVANCNGNAYMHEQATIGTCWQEVAKQYWCTAFRPYSQWVNSWKCLAKLNYLFSFSQINSLIPFSGVKIINSDEVGETLMKISGVKIIQMNWILTVLTLLYVSYNVHVQSWHYQNNIKLLYLSSVLSWSCSYKLMFKWIKMNKKKWIKLALPV